jgi:hypothetical protein
VSLLADDGGEEFSECMHLSIMVCELLSLTLNHSDPVVSETDRGMSMMEGSICVSLSDSSEFTSLLPISSSIFDGLCQASLAQLADL